MTGKELEVPIQGTAPSTEDIRYRDCMPFTKGEQSYIVSQALERASRIDKTPIPVSNSEEYKEIKQQLAENVSLITDLETTANTVPHPKVTSQTNVVWVLSGPGTYSLPLSGGEEKAGVYNNPQNLWMHGFDRARMRTGFAYAREVALMKALAAGENISYQNPDRDKILGHYSPTLLYNGTPWENDVARNVMAQEIAKKKIPEGKVMLYDSVRDRDSGKWRPIKNTIDQVQSLRFPPGFDLEGMTIISHAAHTVRALCMLSAFPDGLRGITPELYPVPLPPSTPLFRSMEYTIQESQGILGYALRKGEANLTPHPYTMAKQSDRK